MKRHYLRVLTVIIISGCTVPKEAKEYCFGQIRYDQLISKKEIINDDYESVPHISKTKVTVLKDSFSKIVYSNKIIYRKYKDEYCLSVKNSSDTDRLTLIDNEYFKSDFQISGKFSPIAQKPHFPSGGYRGTVFHKDGSCVETWYKSYSDSWGAIKSQSLGEYRYVQDTIYVTFFLNRSIRTNLRRSSDNALLNINDIQWNVREPYSLKYTFSNNQDTLNKIYGSKYDKTFPYLVLSGTLKLLPTKPKLH